MMRTGRLLVAVIPALLVALATAGCADGAPPGGDDRADGRGAIAGLVVDDRFRPIHLTDAHETEFDAAGFVLLQETGEQTTTTANGEFAFEDLAPGPYTLRVAAEGHESPAIPVTVAAGEVTEATIVARRILNDQSTLITEEWTVFVPCVLSVVLSEYNFDCVPDQSGDTFRYVHTSDYTAFGDRATWLVTEMLANQQGSYLLDVSSYDDGNRVRYQTVRDPDTDYIRMATQYGIVNPDADYRGAAQPWTNDQTLTTQLFPGGPFEKEITDAWPGNPVLEACCGAGIRAGIEAQLVQSVFIGVPDVDVSAYCTLC